MSENVSSDPFLTNAYYYGQLAGIDIKSVNKTFDSYSKAHSLNYTLAQIALYTTCTYRFQYFKIIANQMLSVSRILFGSMGIVGSAFHLFVLHNKEFRKTSFLYHKAVVSCDSVASLALIFLGLNGIVPLNQQSYAFYILSLAVGNCLWDIFALASDFITTFMTFERCIAIVLPLKFATFNVKTVAISNILLSFILALSRLTDAFGSDYNYDAKSGGSTVTNSFGKSSFYANFNTFRDLITGCNGILIAVCSVTVAVGLFKLSQKPVGQVQDGGSQKKLAVKKQLAILNLICAWPVTLASIGLLIKNYYSKGYLVNVSALILPFDESLERCNRGIFYLLEQYAYWLTRMIVHCLLFYLYLGLSSSFRNITKEMIMKKNKSSSTTVASIRVASLRFPINL